MTLNFQDEAVTAVEEIAEVAISDTQAIKLIKIDKHGEPAYSMQKWWRTSPDDEWNIGKGFQMTPAQYDTLVEAIRADAGQRDDKSRGN